MGTLLGVDFHELSAQCGGNFDDLSVVVFDIAEEVALLVFFADEGLTSSMRHPN